MGNFTGSAAAAMQAMIGDVAAGGIFALMQSAGAGGAELATFNILVEAGAATAVGIEATKAVKEHMAKEE